MKKTIIAISIISVLLFTGCSKNQKNDVLPPNIDEQQNTNISGEITENTKQEDTTSDSFLLEDFKSKVKVVENRRDYNDESGDLFYYIQYDYLESSTDEENINKIVANYAKQEPVLEDDFDGERYYPTDIYYSTSTPVISSVHNGILNIKVGTDWWWGSPHPYPGSSCKNYVLETGEEYILPEEIKDDIYEKAVNEFLNIAKENNYEGLMGSYFDDTENSITYLHVGDETQGTTITNEEAFKKHILETIQNGCFELTDSSIIFHIDAAYNLSDWARRVLYMTIEIPNEWNL